MGLNVAGVPYHPESTPHDHPEDDVERDDQNEQGALGIGGVTTVRKPARPIRANPQLNGLPEHAATALPIPALAVANCSDQHFDVSHTSGRHGCIHGLLGCLRHEDNETRYHFIKTLIAAANMKKAAKKRKTLRR